MRLFFKGIIASGSGVDFVLIPHFHFEEGRHFGFCFLNFKYFISLCDPVDLLPTMLNIHIIHHPMPTESDN